jgi:hypothetical protein
VAEVAGALDLSEDAVKQRLSRGRGMLREQVAELVEGGLRRSRPGRRFTVAVMAGLTAYAAGAKTALAGAGASAGAGAWKAAAGAVGAGGAPYSPNARRLVGGWLGTWDRPGLPLPHATRSALCRRIRWFRLHRRLVRFIYAFAGSPSYPIAWAAWFVAYWAYIAVECGL